MRTVATTSKITKAPIPQTLNELFNSRLDFPADQSVHTMCGIENQSWVDLVEYANYAASGFDESSIWVIDEFTYDGGEYYTQIHLQDQPEVKMSLSLDEAGESHINLGWEELKLILHDEYVQIWRDSL